MNTPIVIVRPSADATLLIDVQSYLAQRKHGFPISQDLEAAWRRFYDHYAHKIRAYAHVCRTTNENLADCDQDVWIELLKRWPGWSARS